MTAAGSFEGRLFGPDLAEAGVAVRARFIGTRLHLDSSPTRVVPAEQLSATLGGFEHDLIFLNFREGAARYALQLKDAQALSALRAQAPAPLARDLARLGGGLWRQKNLWRLIWGGAAASLLTLGLAFWQYDAVVAWIATRISPETEARLGRQVVEALSEQGALIESGPALDAVRDIGDRLTRDSRYDYRWLLLDNEQVNAFAAPGGVVVVHTGLIQAAGSAEELAGVLAHEIQHVELRHSLQNMIHALGWASVLTVVLGDVSALAGVLIYQAGATSFSRDLEREADEQGLLALQKAGIDTRGMLTFFRRLDAERALYVPLLSSHPATAERIERLEQAIRRQPSATVEPLALDWPRIQASLGEAI